MLTWRYSRLVNQMKLDQARVFIIVAGMGLPSVVGVGIETSGAVPASIGYGAGAEDCSAVRMLSYAPRSYGSKY
jgi:NCAIR mutase (PurE)-related protein